MPSSTHTNPRRPVIKDSSERARTVSSGLAFGVQVHAPNPTVLNFRSDRFGTAQVLVAECLRLNADLLYAHRRAQRHDSRDWDPVQARGLEGGPDEREHHHRHGSRRLSSNLGGDDRSLMVNKDGKSAGLGLAPRVHRFRRRGPVTDYAGRLVAAEVIGHRCLHGNEKRHQVVQQIIEIGLESRLEFFLGSLCLLFIRPLSVWCK